MLRDHDFEIQMDENVTADDYLGDLDDSTMRVRLPADAANGNRSVSGLCAICLCPYSAGEKLTWSPKTACQHAFHKDCLIQWLAKKEELKCPVCRQDYCEPIHVDEAFPGSEDLFLDSFALALNYARSHASRSWVNEVSRSSGTGLALGFEPPVRVHVMGGNNDLSLRDNSEGTSQDIEMGPVVRSDSIVVQLPDTNIGEGVEMEEVPVSDTSGISDNREQHLEITAETCNGEADIEEVMVEALENDNDGGIEMEESTVVDTENIAGSTEERSRIDS